MPSSRHYRPYILQSVRYAPEIEPLPPWIFLGQSKRIEQYTQGMDYEALME